MQTDNSPPGSQENNDARGEVKPKPPRREKPAKPLPTDRLSFESQLAILRAYAAASGPNKILVSNADVEKVSGTSSSSISICNPFFNDVGLIVREGVKQRPADAVFEFAHAFQWDEAKAAKKLAPVLSKTWFSQALIPKLAFRSLNRNEAVAFLAEESKATVDHKRQLELLIDYLQASGVVDVNGDGIARPQRAVEPPAPEVQGKVEKAKPESGLEKPLRRQDDSNTFNIPVPGKAPVIVSVPPDLDIDDWAMFASMLDIYICRLKKWKPSEAHEAKEKTREGGG